MIKYQLPDFYSELLPKALLEAVVVEKKATCESCAMAPGQAPALITYDPSLKCCTYHPFQPNYLIGGLLKTGRMAARASENIAHKIKTLEYVLPIGIVAPVPHQVEFNHRTQHEFGNRADWICPYYDLSNQNCGIWKFRGAVCTSFFCQSSYGQKGMQFWESLSDYLTYVEMALMEEALVQLDFSPRQISENLEYLNRFDATPTELEQKTLSPAVARKIWNGYFEDQPGFFIKCYDLVCNMSKKDFKEALGEQGLGIEKSLIKSMKDMLSA